MPETLTEQWYESLRQKIVFHIREFAEGNGSTQITPRSFHKLLLPKFPITTKETVTRLFWDMTHITTNKWVYHELNEEWIDYDKKGMSDVRPTHEESKARR